MEYFDSLETRDPAERERDLMAKLSRQIAYAKERSAYFAETLAGVEPRDIASRQALARLPVVRKNQLIELQKSPRPFGGLNGTPAGQLARIFASPGPIYDPEGYAIDWWRMARALFAAGFRKGEVIHNTLAYHMSPGGFMIDGGARRLGCAVFPAGVGQTEMQVSVIADVRPHGYGGTPSFLRIILEKADELGADVSSLRKALVSGEALPPSLRAWLEGRGIKTRQCYATADIGLIAYETDALEGMVVDEEVVVEIVRPGTGDPVAEGEVGEVVVTTFNPDYPLIRFGTGDLSAVLPGMSPCGRTNTRIKGWMGRADQTAKVKGMFVHPQQIAEVVKQHAEIKRARLVVENPGGEDRMTLRCEVERVGEGLADAIVASIRSYTKLRGEVEFCAPGSLPNDGKIIEDLRKYQ
ncbi:MAG: AMP-binding protein [Pseudomonadota bacterium]|jgi:phenylacetate-CoA ligase